MLLNGQKVTTETEGVGLDSVRVSVKDESWQVIEERILLANCLVNPSTADKYLPIHLMNVTNEDVVLRKDNNIGQLSEVESTKILFESESDPGQAVIRDDVVVVHQLAISKSSGAQNWRDAPDAHIEEWSQPLQDLFHRSINGLSFEESRKLARLIEHNKHTFAKGPTDLGQTSVVTHHIDTGISKPIKQQPRRTPKAFEGEEEKIL